MHSLIMGNGIYVHKDGRNNNNRRNNIINIRGSRNDGKTKLNGYVAIYMPEHDRSFGNGCVYEHILVAEKMLGRKLKDKECVHHKNRNRTDNSEDNLMVFATDRDHAGFHMGNELIQLEDGTFKTKQSENKIFIDKEITKCGTENKPIKRKYTYEICPVCNLNLKTVYANMCQDCAKEKNKSKVKPQKEILQEQIKSYSFVELGRQYGVTDNAVRKWCKSYGLPFRKRDIKEPITVPLF